MLYTYQLGLAFFMLYSKLSDSSGFWIILALGFFFHGSPAFLLPQKSTFLDCDSFLNNGSRSRSTLLSHYPSLSMSIQGYICSPFDGTLITHHMIFFILSSPSFRSGTVEWEEYQSMRENRLLHGNSTSPAFPRDRRLRYARGNQ